MLNDAPPFRVPTDVISLSNVEDAPTVIPSDIGLYCELDNAFIFFSCLGLGVNSTSESLVPNGGNWKTISQSGATSSVHRAKSLSFSWLSNSAAPPMGLCSTSSRPCPVKLERIVHFSTCCS